MCLDIYGAGEAIYLCNVVEKIYQYFRPKNVPNVLENKINCSLQFLKVPKREIFDRSDFPDFYTIKSLRVGDFGVQINKKL